MTTTDRNAWRWRTYPRAIVGAILFGALVVALSASDDGPLQSQLGGDLTAFYSAGSIIREGDGELLYDVDRQLEEQAPYWGDDQDDSAVLFVYPAAFAAPYVPLSALDYRIVYLIHTTFAVGSLVLALHLLRGLIPILAEPTHRVAALAFSLVFLPMFVGTMIGQTTAFIVLALSSVWWGLANHRDVVVGLASGLLLLKPQYGVPVLGLVLLTRRWRAVATALVVGVALWCLSAALAGVGWTSAWFEIVRSLSETDAGSNLSKEVSFLGMAEVILGSGSGLAFAMWVVFTAVMVLLVLWRLSNRPWLYPPALALVPPLLLLIAPHALYYDAGILLLSLGVLLPSIPPARRVAFLALWLLAGLAYLLHDSLGIQPVALLVFGTFGWAWWASDPSREIVSLHPTSAAADP